MKTEEYIKGTLSPTGSYIVLGKPLKTGQVHGPFKMIINQDLKSLVIVISTF